MVRPERVELPTFWFVARRSIQLSYGRTLSSLPFSSATSTCRAPAHPADSDLLVAGRRRTRHTDLSVMPRQCVLGVIIELAL
jgi:hypothetical protein